MDLKWKLECLVTEFMDWFALLFIPIVAVGGLIIIIYLLAIIIRSVI